MDLYESHLILEIDLSNSFRFLFAQMVVWDARTMILRWLMMSLPDYIFVSYIFMYKTFSHGIRPCSCLVFRFIINCSSR